MIKNAERNRRTVKAAQKTDNNNPKEQNKNKNYLTKEYIKDVLKISDKTFQRRLKDFQRSFDLSKFRKKASDGKFEYSYDFLIEITPLKMRSLIEKNVLLKKENDLLKKASFEEKLNNIKPKEILSKHLNKLHWDYFCTLNYKEIMSKDRCRGIMNTIYAQLMNADEKPIRLFFVNESNPKRGQGYHSHFILQYADSKKNIEDMVKLVISQNQEYRFDIQAFSSDKKGIEYINKKNLMINNKRSSENDWDLIGNNLAYDARIFDIG
jgi:hypothetical protein